MEDYDKDFKHINMLKRISDVYPYSGKVKCRAPVPLRHNTLIITSNYAINELFTTEQEYEPISRRFHFVDTSDENWQEDLANYIDNFKFTF